MKSRTIKRYLTYIVSLFAISAIAQKTEPQKSPLKLWYEKPANSWMKEALPIGNGYMGAMFFGGPEEEHIQFNEESIWSEGKGEWDNYDGGNRENAHKYLPEVRRLLHAGKCEEAHKLANKELTGIINKGR